MAYSYDGSYLPKLSTYDAAERFYEIARPFKSDPSTRKLDGNKGFVSIRRVEDGGIACRLHRTDVVTYYPGNRLRIESYASVSTDSFVENLLMHTNIRAEFNRGNCLWLGEKGYYAGSRTQRTVWLQMVDNSQRGHVHYALASDYKVVTWVLRRVNRKRAKEARESSGFDRWSKWVTVLPSLGLPVEQINDRRTNISLTVKDRLNLIASGDADQWWDTLVLMYSYYHGAQVDVRSTVESMRCALYDVAEVYDEEEVEYFDRIQFERWKRQR